MDPIRVSLVLAGLLLICPPAVTSVNASSDALEGLWESGCRVVSPGRAEVQTWDFRGVHFQRQILVFSDSACREPLVAIHERGLSRKRERQDGSVRAVDFIFNNVQVEAKSREGKQRLEAARSCGIAEWTLGEKNDVTQASGRESCWPKTPRQVFDIYSYVARSAGDLLYLGEETPGFDKSTPSGRPVSLDRSGVLTRKALR